MQKFPFISLVFIVFASCSSNENQPSDTKTVEPAKTIDRNLAYPAKRIDWEIGDFNNVKKVIEFYKVWDEKKSFPSADYFADTIRVHIPETNRVLVVPNSEINKKLRENRAMYDSASNDILSAVALHDKESGEDWVMVTTYSKWIESDGKRDSLLYHDDWRLKNGKIDLLLSFQKVPPKGFGKKTAK